MKQILRVLLIALVLLMGTAAFAETYQLHSGITFGMTAEEAIAKQTERGNTFEMVDGRLTNTSSISILSLPATIYYDFDADGGITRQQYRFDKAEVGDLVQEFTKVYGAPDCSSALNTTLALPESSFTGPFPTATEYGHKYVGTSPLFLFSRGGISSYAQWLIEVDSGWVAVEIYGCGYTAKVSGQYTSYSVGSCCLVDYRFFTEAQINDAQQKNADRYNDI